MKTAQVIIGANYGDEGKGLMTDYFASKNPENTIVVRFNGGAQAGHTVVTPDGRRHVFGHFGAASFLGCATFLSKHFIVNPMLLVSELKVLRSKGANPFTYVHPEAIVSTPIDVFINQLIERQRAGGRHGSCGLGINETVTRCLRQDNYRTKVKDLVNSSAFAERLLELVRTWLPARLREHNINLESAEVIAFQSKANEIIERYMQDVGEFLKVSKITALVPDYETILFEGAQGLILDEARIDQYPHLTRSRTGLTNVVEIAKEMNIEELNVTYVTRTYLTRHGAGPLANEVSWTMEDKTNFPNQFQGTLRFAELDFEDLKYSILLDLNQARFKFPRINANIAMTCADQMTLPDPTKLPLVLRYVASGPTRESVKLIEKEFDIPVGRALASAAVG